MVGLIDTGSGCTLLKASVADKYNIAASLVSNMKLRGFADQTVVYNKTTTIEIKIMDASATVNVIIVSDDHINYDIIIGRDFLDQEQVLTITQGKKLIIKQVPVSDVSKSEFTIDIYIIEILTDATIHMGEINTIAKKQCTELIHQYKDCNSLSMRNLGKTNATYLEIRCISDVPVVYRPY